MTSSTAAASDLSPSGYLVTLESGSNVDAYVKRLAAAQPDLLDVHASGIFNTMMLNTRERVRDTATLKALGMRARAR